MTENRRTVPAWLYASLVLTALIAGYSLWQRFQAESLNKSVGIVTEIDNIATYSGGKSLREAVTALKGRGLTGLVLPEETVVDLVADGRVAISGNEIVLKGEDPELRARIVRGLKNRFGAFVAPGGTTIDITGLNVALVRGTAIGLDPSVAKLAKDEGLFVIARMSNPPGISSDYVDATLGWASELGATVFLPQGEQVLGRRDAMDALKDSLKSHQMTYASPEFAKIGGDDWIVSAAPENVLRLHSAQSQELDKLALDAAIERYGKAAAERNQRILLVRPLSGASPDPLDGFGTFIEKIRKQIEREGYKAGVPHPFVDSNVPRAVFLLIGLSTLPAWFWMFGTVIPDSRKTWRYVAFGLLCLAAVGCLHPAIRGYFAFLCAMLYPLISFMLLDLAVPSNILTGFARTTLVSWIGGFCVGGLLNGLPYFVRAEVFEGVKVAHFAPIGVIGIYFFWRFTSARQALKSPIAWNQALLSIVILVLFAFMAARTGNDNPAGVSGIELKFRALLDQFLYVRPRTKEFFMGHPAMILALGMLLRYKGKPEASGGWVALFLSLGAIGQTSIVNTMCHLHTPLALSFARILVGLVLGGILGFVLWGMLSRLTAKPT